MNIRFRACKLQDDEGGIGVAGNKHIRYSYKVNKRGQSASLAMLYVCIPTASSITNRGPAPDLLNSASIASTSYIPISGRRACCRINPSRPMVS